jgi:putative tricarboxylic transport membrane protein
MATTMQVWRPEAPVTILAGTPPGGGLDRVAHALAAALAETGLLDQPAEVVNIPGDGARKVWREVLRRHGDAHLLSISSTNLTTDALLGMADFGHADITPIAILLSEAIAFCVRADSPLRDGADLLRTLARDPASLDIVLATALGNPNHIALAQVARHAGQDPRALRVRAFDGAPQAVAAVVAGEADLGAVSAASVVAERQAGRLRVLALTAPERIPGPLADAPTWIEQGVPCAIGAWRGISGPPGLPEATVAFWREALSAATRTKAWQDALLRQSWAPLLVSGPALADYLRDEEAAMRTGLRDLGLLTDAKATEAP